MTSERDPFAFARQGEDDAELFPLIAEYRRIEREDPEAALGEVFAKIDEYRRVTVRGVSAVLYLYCEDWMDLGWHPENAISALRAIVAREGGR